MSGREFTFNHTGRVLELVTAVQISKAYRPESAGGHVPSRHNFNALWDTGAQASCITQKVVDALGLISIGLIEIRDANGNSKTQPVYLVNIVLPNKVEIIQVRVALGGPFGPNKDILIGMDIIWLGDFHIHNYDGKTVFNFCIPSRDPTHHKYQNPRSVQPEPLPVSAVPRVSPETSDPPRNQNPYPGTAKNALCPCGSGSKYKRCCGKFAFDQA